MLRVYSILYTVWFGWAAVAGIFFSDLLPYFYF